MMMSSWGLRAELEGYCRSGLLLHQRQYVKVLTCKELYSGSSCNLFTSIYGSDTDHVFFCCFIMEQLQKNSVLHMTLDKATLFLGIFYVSCMEEFTHLIT